MSPNEYCKKWIPLLYGVHPGEPDYLKSCHLELLSTLPVSVATIIGWGEHLENYTSRQWVDEILALKSKLNEVAIALKSPVK